MRLWTILLVGAVTVWAQEATKKKRKPKPKTAAEVEIPEPGVKVEDSSVARQEVTRFVKEFKAARKDRARRVKLLGRLGGFDHPLVLKEAARHIKDREYKVAVAAAVACARQSCDKKKAGSTLLKALSREKRTNVICACLVGMGKLEYRTALSYKAAEKYFKRDTKEAHKAAARYLGYIRAKEAFRILAEKLDEPRAANPNSPTNPPASYWRERWLEWQAAVPHIRWAMSRLVEGESFQTTAEAKAWAVAEGKKHGVEWN